jgi:hypothetical protein
MLIKTLQIYLTLVTIIRLITKLYINLLSIYTES